LEWMGMNTIPFSIVFTKADKLKPQAIENNIAAYKTKLMETWEELPPYFITSSANKTGRDDILNYIQDINDTL